MITIIAVLKNKWIQMYWKRAGKLNIDIRERCSKLIISGFLAIQKTNWSLNIYFYARWVCYVIYNIVPSVPSKLMVINKFYVEVICNSLVSSLVSILFYLLIIKWLFITLFSVLWHFVTATSIGGIFSWGMLQLMIPAQFKGFYFIK